MRDFGSASKDLSATIILLFNPALHPHTRKTLQNPIDEAEEDEERNYLETDMLVDERAKVLSQWTFVFLQFMGPLCQ